MAGPWEKYQDQPAAKPWEKYGAAAADTATPDDESYLDKAKKAASDLPGSIREAVGSVAEPVMHAASAMVAKPVGEVAGLARLGMEGARRAGVPGIEERDPLKVSQDVQSALTYEPRTEAGKSEYNPLNAIPGAIGRAVGWAGDTAKELVAPPKTAGPVRSAIGEGVGEAVRQAPGFLGLKAAPSVAEAAAGGLRGGAENLMRRSLKPTITDARSEAAANTAVKTALDEGITVSKGGLEKLQGKIGDINKRIAQHIENSPAVIDKKAVASRLNETMDKFQKQVDSLSDVKAIQKVWDNFMGHPLLKGDTIPVQAAQEMKQGTYRSIGSKAYGELKGATAEAQKTLARGLKEEIAKAVPDVAPLNAQDSKLMATLPILEQRVLREANKNPAGLGILSLNPAHFALWMADRSSMFKSLVGRMLNQGSKAVRPMGNIGAPLGMTATGLSNPPPQQ